MEQLLCHLTGDFLLQTSWMANNKSKRWWPAIVHVTIYTSVFLLLTQSPLALFVIWFTHLLIDHYKLPQYWFNIVRGKEDSPDWFLLWLYVVQDNTCHLIINYLALRYL